MEYWDPTCLSSVANGIGRPLYIDSLTQKQQRLGFARVLVEDNIHDALSKEIEIDLGNDSITVGVEYSWIPIKCKMCSSFGHATYACTKKEKKV